MTTALKSKMPQPKEWDIFISYRRSEKTEKIATWLQTELEKEPVESTTGQFFNLDVFVDTTEPHRPDFQRNLTPILQHSRALIVLADAGAAQRKAGADYLYQELDWWAENRKGTPFIVLQMDIDSGKSLVNDKKFKANAWEKVNCLDCLYEKWEIQNEEGAAYRAKRILWVRESIRDYGQVIHHDEVRRLKKRAVIAWIFALIALAGAAFAIALKIEADTQREEANVQREQADKLAKIAEQEARKADVAANKAKKSEEQTQKTLLDLQREQVATEKANSRTSYEAALKLIDQRQAASAVALLTQACRLDATNLSALSELLVCLIETQWWHPECLFSFEVDQATSLSLSPKGDYLLISSIKPNLEATDEPIPTHWNLYRLNQESKWESSGSLTSSTDKNIIFSKDQNCLIEIVDGPKPNTKTRYWTIPDLKVGPKTIIPTAYEPIGVMSVKIEGANVIMESAGKKIGNTLLHPDIVNNAWVSRDARYAVTQFGDAPLCYVDFWRVGENQGDPNRQLLSIDNAELSDVLFSAGTNFLGYAIQYEGYDGPPMSEVYRLEGDRQLRVPCEFFRRLQLVTFSEDGVRAISFHEGNLVVSWRMEDPARDLPRQSDWMTEGNFLNDRKIPLSQVGDAVTQPQPLKAVDLLKIMPQLPEDTESMNTQGECGYRSLSGKYILFQWAEDWRLLDVRANREIALPLKLHYINNLIMSSDENLAAFESGDNIYVLRLSDGHIVTAANRSSQRLDFSINKRFLIASDVSRITVFETETLALIGTHQDHFITDLWASELVLELCDTQLMSRLSEALTGKRVTAAGEILGVSPSEWIKLKSQPPVGESTTEKMSRWLLKLPTERPSGLE